MRVGTGFFVDPKGEIFTAANVVAGAQKVFVEWQNQRLEARLVGVDRDRSNLAMLSVVGQPPTMKFPALTLCAAGYPKVGSFVTMIGFPGDLPPSPSVGVVGGMGMYRYTPVMLTRVNVSPGEIGAPLLNTRGQVVGMLYGSSAQMPNVALALPTAAAQRVAADLRQFGEPRYGSFGMGVSQVVVQAGSNAVVQPALRIDQVVPGTVAAQAGVQPGDLLLAVNQKPVRVLEDLTEAMFYMRVGDQVQMQVLRSNQVNQVSFGVATRKPAVVPSGPRSEAPAGRSEPPPIQVVPAAATGIPDNR
jgi:serine protease Do